MSDIKYTTKENKTMSKSELDLRFEIRKNELLDIGFLWNSHIGYFEFKEVWGSYWEQVYLPDDVWFEEYVKAIKIAIKEKTKIIET